MPSTGISTLQARTAAPSSVDLNTAANAEGSSTSFARADHTHAVTITPGSWIAPTLLNSWVNFSGTHTAGYRKTNGLVEVRGTIKDGTATDTTTLFNLPSGYRPATDLNFAVAASGGPVMISVQTNGDVKAQGAINATWTALNGITFSVS